MRERGPEGENALAGKPARTTCDCSGAAGALAYHLDRRAIDQNDLVAPIELIGFPGASSGECKPETGALPRGALCANSWREQMHRIVTPIKFQSVQRFENPHQRQATRNDL